MLAEVTPKPLCYRGTEICVYYLINDLIDAPSIILSQCHVYNFSLNTIKCEINFCTSAVKALRLSPTVFHNYLANEREVIATNRAVLLLPRDTKRDWRLEANHNCKSIHSSGFSAAIRCQRRWKRHLELGSVLSARDPAWADHGQSSLPLNANTAFPYTPQAHGLGSCQLSI
jgi:hypothetical protein